MFEQCCDHILIQIEQTTSKFEQKNQNETKTKFKQKTPKLNEKKHQNCGKNVEAILKFSNNVTEISRQLIAEIQIAEKKCQRNL